MNEELYAKFLRNLENYKNSTGGGKLKGGRNCYQTAERRNAFIAQLERSGVSGRKKAAMMPYSLENARKWAEIRKRNIPGYLKQKMEEEGIDIDQAVEDVNELKKLLSRLRKTIRETGVRRKDDDIVYPPGTEFPVRIPGDDIVYPPGTTFPEVRRKRKRQTRKRRTPKIRFIEEEVSD